MAETNPTELAVQQLTARVEALENRRSATRLAEHWLVVDARKVALARRGLSMEAGKVSRVSADGRAEWLALCERKLSCTIDELADAALADSMDAALV